MGARKPEGEDKVKKFHMSVGKAWLLWTGIWTAVLGISLLVNLQAAEDRSRQAVTQAASAAIDLYDSWRSLAAECRLFIPRPQETETEVTPVLLDRTTPPGGGMVAVDLDSLLCQLRRLPVQQPEVGDTIRVQFMAMTNLNGSERQALAELGPATAGARLVVAKDPRESLHVLRPERLGEECHRCHQPAAGDFFGVVKASLPREPFLARERQERHDLLFFHGLLWLAGVGFLGARTLREQRLRGQHRQTTDALQRELGMREQLDDCPDGLCIVQENIIRYANRRLAAMVGLPIPEITASPMTSLLPADQLAAFSREIGKLIGTGGVINYGMSHPGLAYLPSGNRLQGAGDARHRSAMCTFVHEQADNTADSVPCDRLPGGVTFDSALLHREGSRLDVEVHAGNSAFAGEKAFFLSLREIGARKQREEAAESSRALLQSILDGMADSVTVFDADYRLLLMNKKARQLYGEGEGAIHSPFCFQLVHGSENRCPEKDQACPMKRVLESKRSCLVIHNHRTKEGGEVPVEITASPIFDQMGEITGIIEVGRDIGHRLKREEEWKRTAEGLCRREKEEAIATLIGGLAHDYNNILAVILGNGELLRMKMVAVEEEPKLHENICQAAKRMADLNRQLLASARLGPRNLRPLALNPLLEEVVRCQGPPPDVRCRRQLAADLWPVRADAAQMRQLFGNLLANAHEVLGDKGGEVGITSGNIRMEKEFRHGERQLPAGDYVRVEVSDSGPGIEKDIGSRIFDPFFSTKFIGRGLGLAAAKGIVESHGGGIAVQNGRERGCVFELLLPREPPVAGGKARPAPRSPAILIVEDDPEMVKIFRETLAGAGYGETLVAGSGEKGVATVARKRQELALIILDIRLPGISGREVYRRVRAAGDDVRVLIASGYSRDEALSGLSFHPQDAFLQKPFVRDAFLGEVERLLAASAVSE